MNVHEHVKNHKRLLSDILTMFVFAVRPLLFGQYDASGLTCWVTERVGPGQKIPGLPSHVNNVNIVVNISVVEVEFGMCR